MNNLVIKTIDGELRVLDTDLAARLGFAEPRAIRKLIKRHEAALAKLGVIHRVPRIIEGNETTEYYLNKKQSIFTIAKSETPAAVEMTIAVIEKFDAYERGERPAGLDALQQQIAAVVAAGAALQIISARMDEQERRTAKTERAIEGLKETLYGPGAYVSIMGYFKERGWGSLSVREAGPIGRRVSAWCRTRGFPIRSAPSEIFGSVNTYLISALDEYFAEHPVEVDDYFA